MDEALSKSVVYNENREMLEKAQEIVALFQDAIKLGYAISFSPDQLKTLVAICENGYLYKPTKGDQ